MSLIPAMFQYVRKLVGANEEKRVAFAPLATPFTNEDFLFMDTEIFKSDPTRYYSEALEFSQKANSIIRDPNIWEVGSTDFVYENLQTIMTRARLIESREFTAEELAAQGAARKVLFQADEQPTPAYASYKKLEAEHADLLNKISDPPDQTSAEFTSWAATLKSLQKQLRDKEVEWNALGFRNEIDKALKVFGKPLDNAERELFAVQWHAAQMFLDTIKSGSAASGSDIFPMTCTPNNLFEYEGTKWTKVTLNKEQINSLTAALKEEVKELDSEEVFGTGGLDLESIDFEICRVIFSRSWLNENLLLSRFWDYPDGLVASGEKGNFEGLLPAYPVEFILVKNVSPLLVPDSPANEPMRKSLQQGEPVFVGPFMIKSTQTEAGQGKPLQVQTFTSRQLSTITTALAINSGGVAVTTDVAPRRKAVQLLRRVRAGMAGMAEVRDHRGGREPAIAAPALRGPVVRDHRGTPPDGTPPRAGYVWVDDHWERERARPPEQPKIAGSIVDQDGQAIANAEITLLAGSVLQNDMSEENGGFIIENVSPGDHHLTVKKDGYSIAEKEVKVAGALDVGKITLSSKTPVESYLLLGVVYRKLAKLPNPIKGASYL